MSAQRKTTTKKTTNLSIGLIERLREDILSEKLPSGSKLTEQNLSNQYEVSRTPVREAFINLQREGLINLIPNKGAFVVGFTAEDMKDLLELRKAYEIQAIKWAIERITEDEMENLEKCFEFMKFYTKQEDIKKLRDINQNFHNTIYEATHNRTLINILSLYNHYIRHSVLTNTVIKADLDVIFDEHTHIYDAFLERNIRSGIEAITIHIHNATDRYML